MEVKTVFKNEEHDFVYNFDPKLNNKEYIALPTQKEDERVTFHRAMKITVFIGQLFGLNPVLGIFEDDGSKMRFTYHSGRCIYSILTVVGQFIFVCFCLLKVFWDRNASLNSNSAIIFFASNSIVTVLFLRLAKHWPKLSRQISKMETIDPNTDKTLIWKCNATTLFIFILGAVEHGFSDLSGISGAIACSPEQHPYDAHLIQSFYWVWAYIPYNTIFGLIAKFICIQCTFNYNYSGSFIMCLCWYLDARLQQINDRLNEVRGKVAPSSFWRTMREDYTKTTSIIRKVDKLVNGIIFVSFTVNLISICFLILHTFEEGFNPTYICDVPLDKRILNGYEHIVYYIAAIAVLVLRSLGMSLLAAKVNITSNQTAVALYDVPSDTFDVEVQRFIDQVHGDSIVLSGLQLFSIKRGTILTIAAAIVTYELVLIQFSSENK